MAMRFRTNTARRAYRSLVDRHPLRSLRAGRTLDQVVLHVTSTCNLRCKYCFAVQGSFGLPVQHRMRSDQAIRFVDNIVDSYDAVGQIKFFGGEPLLNVECIRAVCEHLSRRFDRGSLARLPRFHINTSLTLGLDQLVELIELFNLTVTVGIDGPREVHDAQRCQTDGSGTFDLVDHNLRELIELTDQPRTLEVVYTSVHLRRRMGPVDVHRYLARRYGHRNIHLHPQTPVLAFAGEPRRPRRRDYGRPGDLRRVFMDYGRYLVQQAMAQRDPASLRAIGIQLGSLVGNDQYCDSGIAQLAIDVRGDVYPCSCFAGHPGFLMGNAEDFRGVEGGRFRSVRRALLGNRKSKSRACRFCEIAKSCVSCPAAMLKNGGALDTPLPQLCAARMGMVEGLMSALVEVTEELSTPIADPTAADALQPREVERTNDVDSRVC